MMRVHELAKELKVTNKDVLTLCQKFGFADVKSPLSTLEDDSIEKIRRDLLKAASMKALVTPHPSKLEPVAPKPPKAQPVVVEPKVETEAPAAPKAAVKPASAKAKAPKETKEQPAPAAPAPLEAPKDTKKETAAPAKKATPAPEAPVAAKKTVAKPTKAPAKPAHAETAPATQSPADKVIHLKGALIVRELAELLGEKTNKIVAELMAMNVFASINERLELAVARRIAEKHGFTIELEKKVSDYSQIRKTVEEIEAQEENPDDLVARPPIVTFLGHVDHGKTSLLDKIRNAAVAKGECGGITQHIGAYSVELAGKCITFLDTPGHEAFTAMRARGANLTDIAVIIVATDDGVMPQTKEAIMHAKAADVTIMVAMNKIDLPTANPERVKQQLQVEDLAPEDWGGTTICVPVSAVTGKGVDHLLEMILLQSEVLELKANPKHRAQGFVVEARLQQGMGPIATLLVMDGVLKVGDPVLCGRYWGRVRALTNDRGIRVNSVGPGHAIQCLGLSGVPEAGAEFKVRTDDKSAREAAEKEEQRLRTEQISVPKRASLADLFTQLKEDEKKELKVIVKADTQGSIEAITHSLQTIKSDKVSLNIVMTGTGNVTVSDVMLASASDGIILGFHVAKEPGTEAAARHEGIEIRIHQIIYDLIDEVRNAMLGLLQPEHREKITGHAHILKTFEVGKNSKAAGCRMADGVLNIKSKIRVKRNNEVLLDKGTLDSLQILQERVSEVREGQECGLRINGYKDFQEGDFLEFFDVEEIQQTL